VPTRDAGRQAAGIRTACPCQPAGSLARAASAPPTHRAGLRARWLGIDLASLRLGMAPGGGRVRAPPCARALRQSASLGATRLVRTAPVVSVSLAVLSHTPRCVQTSVHAGSDTAALRKSSLRKSSVRPFQRTRLATRREVVVQRLTFARGTLRPSSQARKRCPRCSSSAILRLLDRCARRHGLFIGALRAAVRISTEPGRDSHHDKSQ